MTGSPRLRTIAALTACVGALAYTASKVHLAREGRLGMPGFPAPPESYREVGDVAAAQLGNAGVGLAMAVLVLALLRPPASRPARWGVVAVSWTGNAVVTAGVVGFGARTTGIAPALGPPPPDLASALAVLAVGAVWITAWAMATVEATRGCREGRADPAARAMGP